MHYKLVLILIIVYLNNCYCSVIISRYDESDCELDYNLVKEIASYKNVTKQIMEEVTSTWGPLMYQKYTEFIDKFGARPSGTEVLEKAIDHMIQLTKENGLNDVTTEEIDAPHWIRGKESATMISPRHQNIAILGLGSSISTPLDGITAEVIVVKSFEELEKIDDANVKGKIVVFNAPYTTYGKTAVYRTQGATKAAIKGAVVSLIRSVTPYSLYTLHTGAQFYGENVTKIPTACITLEDADLFQRLQDEGEKIVLNVTMLNTFDMKKSRNTIIDLKGREHPEKVVIVSGHIDSWDVGQGAIDDGGGMMISWFAPVLLNQLNLRPKRTLRAILWTSEEPGLIGAAEYFKRHTQDLPNINFIMESDEGTFKPLGLEVGGSKKATCIIAEILKVFTPIDKITESSNIGSDIAMFVRKGVPGASLLNENDRYFWFHHSEADTLNVQNMTNVINCAAFWSAVSYVIADLSQDIPR